MAETQESTDGYMGEFWLHNGSALYELREVRSFKIPEPGEREKAENTHLKTTGRRHSYLYTFFADSTFDVVVNARALSDTAVLLDDARGDADTRAFKAVIPEDGAAAAQVTGTCVCENVDRGTVENGTLIESTATFRVVTIDAVVAYSA